MQQQDSFIPSGVLNTIDVVISPLSCWDAQLCQLCTNAYLSGRGTTITMSAAPMVFRMCWVSNNKCFLACKPTDSTVWKYVYSDFKDWAYLTLVNDSSQATRYYISSSTFSREGWGTTYSWPIFS